MKIVGDDGPVGDGAIGEIWVRSPSRARGYWESPATSARDFGAALAGEAAVPPAGDDGVVDPRGWLRTGDSGFVLEREVFVCGRLKDLLIVRGKNYYPQDLEKAWEDGSRGAFRPGCSAFVPLATDDGEGVQVVCEARGGDVDAAAACEAAGRAVADAFGIQVSRATVCGARSVPKTTSGKIARKWSARALDEGSLDVVYAFDGTVTSSSSSSLAKKPTATARDCIKTMDPAVRASKLARCTAMSEAELLESVRGIAASVMKVERASLDADDVVATFGLGSMEGLHLLTMVEEEHGCAPAPELLLDGDMTLRTMAALLARGGVAGPRAKILDGAALARELRDADAAFMGAAKRIAGKRKDRDRRCTLAQAHLATGALERVKGPPVGDCRRPLVDVGPLLALATSALCSLLAFLLVGTSLVGPAATVAVLCATPFWLGTRGAKIAGASPKIAARLRKMRFKFLADAHEKRATRVYVQDPAGLLASQRPLLIAVREAAGGLEASTRDARANQLATAALYPDLLGRPVVPFVDDDYVGAVALKALFKEARAPAAADAAATCLFAKKHVLVFLDAKLTLKDLCTLAATAGATLVPALSTRDPATGRVVHAVAAPLPAPKVGGRDATLAAAAASYDALAKDAAVAF